MPDTTNADVSVCLHCRTELDHALLRCPVCRRLVHADTLTELSRTAERAGTDGDTANAVAAWRLAIQLLPPDAPQIAVIRRRIAALTPGGDRRPTGTTTDGSSLAKAGAAAGAFGLLVWKFKFVFAFILTKGKLLLSGLTKSGTILSMLASVGVYWTAWGWKFATGLVLSIYVHEMGHVAALRRFGIKATAPMFVPGLGAFVRLKEAPADRHEDARVGLAGPWWGWGIAVAAYGASLATGWSSLGAIAQFGAWINLFNLLPVWQLDGGRGFRALNKPQRWTAVFGIAAAWVLTREGLLVLLGIGAVVQAFATAPDEPDHRVLVDYVFLVFTLSLLATIRVVV